MKKAFFVVFMVCAAVYGIFANTTGGVIRELTGNVELKPAGSSDFVAASSGDEVARNTIISTGFKSSAIIAIGSTVITVRPLTRLSLADIQSSAGTENINVDLQAGRVRVDVKPPAGTKANFKVQSPAATASVRGTSFEFDMVNVTVNEGKVAFNGTSGLVTMVDAGKANSIGKDREPSASIVIGGSFLPLPPAGMTPNETLTQSSAPSGGDVDIRINFAE